MRSRDQPTPVYFAIHRNPHGRTAKARLHSSLGFFWDAHDILVMKYIRGLCLSLRSYRLGFMMETSEGAPAAPTGAKRQREDEITPVQGIEPTTDSVSGEAAMSVDGEVPVAEPDSKRPKVDDQPPPTTDDHAEGSRGKRPTRGKRGGKHASERSRIRNRNAEALEKNPTHEQRAEDDAGKEKRLSKKRVALLISFCGTGLSGMQCKLPPT